MPTINKTKAWLFGLTLVIAVCIIYETSSRSQTVTTQNVPIQRIQSNISHRQELALFWNEADYKKRLPKCIIVGVRKAGTRALKDFLSIHPRIVVAKREQHFFGLPLKYRKGMVHRWIFNIFLAFGLYSCALSWRVHHSSLTSSLLITFLVHLLPWLSPLGTGQFPLDNPPHPWTIPPLYVCYPWLAWTPSNLCYYALVQAVSQPLYPFPHVLLYFLWCCV